MPVETVNIGEYGYMPFSFGCVKTVYSGGIYMKFAVFLRSDNSACNFFRNNATFFDWCNYFMVKCNFFRLCNLKSLHALLVEMKHKAGNEFLESNTNALFQCKLTIKSKSGFVPVYKRSSHKSFEEEKNDMLYDMVNNYSYGHGCSSVFAENNGVVDEIQSEFVPQYRMLQMMPRLLNNSEYLFMSYFHQA